RRPRDYDSPALPLSYTAIPPGNPALRRVFKGDLLVCQHVIKRKMQDFSRRIFHNGHICYGFLNPSIPS
ncbi:MAG: hypothetical protein ABF812_11215, partial [Gluconobacter cerinus]|uniref:hypothetical protein n=1 Tax=Gluconobacter cerinus TaxID=38307 RepID=UPI0039EB9C45